MEKNRNRNEADSRNLGKMLRKARTRHKLSQRQLGERTGVNHSTISLIEQDGMNPSVAVMMKLLSGLELSFSEFWDQNPDAMPTPFFSQDAQTVVKTATSTYFQVISSGENKNLLLQREIYEPGAGTGDRDITHESEEAGFIIEGRVEVIVGDQVRTLKAGEAYYFDSRIPHRFRNVGDGRAIIVSACTPPSF